MSYIHMYYVTQRRDRSSSKPGCDHSTIRRYAQSPYQDYPYCTKIP